MPDEIQIQSHIFIQVYAENLHKNISKAVPHSMILVIEMRITNIFCITVRLLQNWGCEKSLRQFEILFYYISFIL
jgi:hypothetical protein